LTPPEPDDVLLRFYRKVRPHAAGVAAHCGARSGVAANAGPRQKFAGVGAWVRHGVCCAVWYREIVLGQTGAGIGLLGLAAVCAMLLYRDIAERMISEPMGGAGV